jgi:3-dehydroquinate dehydratase
LTWAAASEGSESAPGQMTAEDMKKIFKMLGNN